MSINHTSEKKILTKRSPYSKKKVHPSIDMSKYADEDEAYFESMKRYEEDEQQRLSKLLVEETNTLNESQQKYQNKRRDLSDNFEKSVKVRHEKETNEARKNLKESKDQIDEAYEKEQENINKEYILLTDLVRLLRDMSEFDVDSMSKVRNGEIYLDKMKVMDIHEYAEKIYDIFVEHDSEKVGLDQLPQDKYTKEDVDEVKQLGRFAAYIKDKGTDIVYEKNNSIMELYISDVKKMKEALFNIGSHLHLDSSLGEWKFDDKNRPDYDKLSDRVRSWSLTKMGECEQRYKKELEPIEAELSKIDSPEKMAWYQDELKKYEVQLKEVNEEEEKLQPDRDRLQKLIAEHKEAAENSMLMIHAYEAWNTREDSILVGCTKQNIPTNTSVTDPTETPKQYKIELDIIAQQMQKSAKLTDSKEYKELLAEVKRVQKIVELAATPGEIVESGRKKQVSEALDSLRTAMNAYRRDHLLDANGQLKKPLKGEQPNRLKLINRLENLIIMNKEGVTDPHTGAAARRLRLAEKIVHADLMNKVKTASDDNREMRAFFDRNILNNRLIALMENDTFDRFFKANDHEVNGQDGIGILMKINGVKLRDMYGLFENYSPQMQQDLAKGDLLEKKNIQHVSEHGPVQEKQVRIQGQQVEPTA